MSSYDSETVGEDILSALKADGQLAAPAGARARVLSRLGAGAAAATATVAVPASVGAAVGKAAGASAAPVAGGAVGFGLVNGLVAKPVLSALVALAVASGAGFGAYVVLNPTPASRPAVTRGTPALGGAPRPVEARSLPASPPALPTAATSPEERHSERTIGPAHPSLDTRAAPAPEPALVPGPDLPGSGSVRLAEQQALLDQARAWLRRGDGTSALAVISEHERRHPTTTFAEERDAIGILALVMVGRTTEARSRAEAFARRHPTSLFLPSIRASLAAHDPATSDPDTTE